MKVALKVSRSLVLSTVMKVSAAVNYVEFEGSHIKGHTNQLGLLRVICSAPAAPSLFGKALWE